MKMYGRAHETANQIIEAFQHPETLPQAIAPIFIRRKDNSPCRRWSWRNQLLTALAGTGDARGYRQWQEADRHVKKGAHAFHILSPCTKKVTEEDGSERVAVFGFRATPVFRLEDTEGADIPSGDPEIDRWIENLPLRAVAQAWGITVSTFNGGETGYKGFYRCSSKTIALGVQNAEVFLHELIHAADHHLGNATEKGQHWRKETVAEFGSAILAECLGLDHARDLGGAYQYVEAYAKAAEKTVQAACMECLDRICQAVTLVLDTAESIKNQPAAAVA